MTPDHRADHRDHLGAAVGVRAGRVHPRHRRQALPAIRGRRVGVDADLGAERADPVAGAVRAAAAPRARRPAGSSARCRAASTVMQRGYAGIVGRLAPRVLLTVALVGVAVALIWWFGRAVPSGFLPEEDQGALLIEAQLPEGASLNRTGEVAAEVERIAKATPGVAAVTSIVGYSMLDGIAQSNKATVLRDPGAVRRPHLEGARACGACSTICAADFVKLPAAIVIPFNLPPIIGLGTGAGFEYQLQSYAGAARERDGRGRARAGAGGEREPGAGRRLHHLRRLDAADPARHRPRAGRDPGDQHQRHLHRAAGHARRLLRQRLQQIRPHLAGDPASRDRAAHARSRTSSRCMSARRTARWCRSARSPRSRTCSARATSTASTICALWRSRGGRRRVIPRVRRWRRWSRCRRRPCRRASAIRGAAPPTRKRSPAARPR